MCWWRMKKSSLKRSSSTWSWKVMRGYLCFRRRRGLRGGVRRVFRPDHPGCDAARDGRDQRGKQFASATTMCRSDAQRQNSSADRVMGLKKEPMTTSPSPSTWKSCCSGFTNSLTRTRNCRIKPRWGPPIIWQQPYRLQSPGATTRDGSRVQLSKKETMLLRLLIENRTKWLRGKKILQAVWGYNVYPTTQRSTILS